MQGGGGIPQRPIRVLSQSKRVSKHTIRHKALEGKRQKPGSQFLLPYEPLLCLPILLLPPPSRLAFVFALHGYWILGFP